MNTEELKISKNNIFKGFAPLVLSLIVSCCILYFLVFPLYKVYRINILAVDVKERNITDREILLSSVKSRNQEKNDRYDKNVDKIKNLVYVRDDYEGFMANLIEFAENREMIVDNFFISEGTVSKDNFRSKEISFSLTGGFENLLNYLEDLERNIPLINVELQNIAKLEENTDEAAESENSSSRLLTVSMKTKFYYIDNEKK